jgi:hypothetical protein
MKAHAETEIQAILTVLESVRDGDAATTTAVGSGVGGKSTLPLRFNGKVTGLVG